MNIREFVDLRARNSFNDDIGPFCVVAVAQMDYYGANFGRIHFRCFFVDGTGELHP